jgi:hypothetical protein
MATEHQIKQTEKALRDYRKKYLTKKQNLELDESATRLMVNFFLTDVLGYKELDDIKTEYNIRGEYADYVIQLARKKHIVIEVKSIQLDLNDRHLRQCLSYAANEGIDWIMLFNGRQMRLYRVLFGKPISYHLLFDYDLADLSVMKSAANDISNLLKKLVERGELNMYWKRFDALTPSSLVKTLYTEDVIKAIRLKIKKSSGINFDQSDVLSAIHELVLHECSTAIKPKSLK